MSLAAVIGAENGAERAETQMSGSGAWSGRSQSRKGKDPESGHRKFPVLSG